MQFTVEETKPENVFTPEDFTSEHQMIRDTTKRFAEERVVPHREAIESQDFALTVNLLREAGKLGLLAHSVPKEYGGLGLDKISKALVGENIGCTSSYAVAHSNHTCIATLPITYFGTPEQKEKYLPKLASGEYLGAYCLTESSAGSDALSAKTTAKLNREGTHYLLNGSKQWITNAGFSQTFIVYANVDGDKFTAFIVEKDFPGLILGNEEKKMGIHGSSTRTVIFEDCEVPVENVLGEIGKGHVIALNVLNLGRFNLGGVCLGAAKTALELTIKYTKQRKQFNQPIAAFKGTQEKLALMASQIYTLESLQYRTAGLLEESLHMINDNTDSSTVVKHLMEYAAECSICKVFGSEVYDYVVDECVQLHGGYGFMREYRIEQMYRDSRIKRIFEGTNEINRLLISSMIPRKIKNGDLSLEKAIKTMLSNENITYVDFDHSIALEFEIVRSMRKVFLLLTRLLLKLYRENFREEQEALFKLSNLAIHLYAAESAVLRTQKAIDAGCLPDDEIHWKKLLMKVAVYHSFIHVEVNAKQFIRGIEGDSSTESEIDVVEKELSKYKIRNEFAIKREIAAKLIENEKYI